MIPTYALIEREVRRRSETDREMSFGTFILWTVVLGILGVIGALIYGVVIDFQLLNRRNDHFARQHGLIRELVNGLREQHGSNARVRAHLDTIDGVRQEMLITEGRREPWLWVLLWPLLTLGIAGFWTLYWLTVDWRRHAGRQRMITGELSAIFREIGYPAPNLTDEGVTPERKYWLFLVLTLVTLGIFGIYWQYVIFRDGNVHMRADEFWEDQLLNTLRLAA